MSAKKQCDQIGRNFADLANVSVFGRNYSKNNRPKFEQKNSRLWLLFVFKFQLLTINLSGQNSYLGSM
jgi:hypothetical protein